MTDVAGGGFDIGRVIERTFGVTGRNFAVFAGLALLLTGAPRLLIGLAGYQMAGDGGFDGATAVAGAVGTLVNLVGAFVLQAALVHGTVADLNGRRVSFGDCLRTGLNHFLPVLVISILASIGVVLGLALLIVPGVMLAVAWAVVTPVRVVEGAGVFRSFSRSAELTRGSRWPIFGLLVIYVILSMILGGLFIALAGGISGGSLDAGSRLMVTVIGSPIVDSLVAMVGAAGVACAYYELRTTKEGAGPESLAAIFD